MVIKEFNFCFQFQWLLGPTRGGGTRVSRVDFRPFRPYFRSARIPGKHRLQTTRIRPPLGLSLIQLLRQQRRSPLLRRNSIRGKYHTTKHHIQTNNREKDDGREQEIRNKEANQTPIK